MINRKMLFSVVGFACAACSDDAARSVQPPGNGVPPILFTQTGVVGVIDPVANSSSPISVSLTRSPVTQSATYTLTASASGATSGLYTYTWFVQDCYSSYCTANDAFNGGDGLNQVTYTPPAGVIESRGTVLVNETGQPSYTSRLSNGVHMKGPQWGIETGPSLSCVANGYPLTEAYDSAGSQQSRNYRRNICTGQKEIQP